MSIHGRHVITTDEAQLKVGAPLIQGEPPPYITGARTMGFWLDCLSLVPSDRQRSHEPVEGTTHFFHIFFACFKPVSRGDRQEYRDGF